MTPFQFPKATDAAWVKPLLNAEGLALCNYSFPVLFCWQHAYDFRYAREGDRLLTRLTSSLGHSYLWPVGKGTPGLPWMPSPRTPGRRASPCA